jgi:drug/metabolite transporter (DMT)-like permease
MSRLQANFLLLLAGAIWGAGFIAQSTAMETLGPIWFIGLRFAVATLVAVPFALSERKRASAPVRLADRTGFLVTGLALFAAAAAQQVGLLTTTVTNSGFLTGLYVVFTPILTVFVLRKRPHWVIWPAAAMATAGIFLLSGGAFAALTTGDLLNILCALLWSVQMI